MPTAFPYATRPEGAPLAPTAGPFTLAPAVSGGTVTARVLASVSAQVVPSTGSHVRFYIPTGDWTQLRLKGVCGKDVDTITTLTAAIYDRPASSGTSATLMSSTNIDVEGAGPDDFAPVNEVLPLPSIATYGRMYELRLTVDSSAGDLFGLLLTAEE